MTWSKVSFPLPILQCYQKFICACIPYAGRHEAELVIEIKALKASLIRAPIDTTYIAFKLNLIKKHLSSPIFSGCFAGIDIGKELINLDPQEFKEKIETDENELIQVDSYTFNINDTSLQEFCFGR